MIFFRHMIALVFISSLLSLNLTLHDYDNPSASHILDTEIIDDLLIVSGMIGGIEFYDISNRETLNHLSTLNLPGGGGGGGKGGSYGKGGGGYGKGGDAYYNY